MNKLFFKRYLFSSQSGSLIKIMAWVSLFATFFGLSALIIVTSVMNGLNRNMSRRLFRFEPHLVALSTPFSPLSTEEQIQIETQFGVQIFPYEKQDVIVRTLDGYFSTVEAVGVESGTQHYLLEEVEKQRAREESRVSSGSSDFSDQDNLSSLKENEILIGQDLAFQLNIFEGSEVLIIPPETLLLPQDQIPKYRKMTVKKIIRTDVQKLDSQTLFYSLQGFINRGLSLEKGYEFRLKDPYAFSLLREELKEKGFQVESWIERNGILFLSLKLEKITMTLCLAFSALITSFIIFSILILLITQKKKDMGILLSLGLSSKKIQVLFFQFGFWLSFTGIFSGIAFGTLVSILIDLFPIPILPDIYYERSFPAKVSFYSILIISLLGLCVAAISAWLPTRSLNRLSPSDCLRLS